MHSYIVSGVGLIPIFCGVYLLYKLLLFGSRDKRLPPGPPTIPILGNAHQMLTPSLEKRLKAWGDVYGNIFSLKVGAGTIIVLNDKRTVHDLVDKKSAIYSERPFDHNTETAMGNENFAFIHASTSLWRAQRKIASQFLAPINLDKKVMPIQEAESCQLVHDLLETPEQFIDHVKRVTASVASSVIFGQRGATPDSFWATCVYTAMDQINPTLAPGTYLPIEQFPILRFVPDRLIPTKARATRCYQIVTSVWTEAKERVEQRRNNGDTRDSLLDRLLSEEIKCDVQLSPNQLANFVGTLMQGAAETTSNVMLSHILFIAKYPWVQRKAQAELDHVCGTERMPTWTDFKALPYINCIIKEGLRIRPILPCGAAHRVSKDDWFDNYLIPKDSTVFIPPWGLHQSHYEDPELYNPDRYLNHPRLAMDYAGSPDYENRDHYTYGAGRRICAGIHLAERIQWRLLARLLWAFNIEPSIDETTGEAIELDTNAYTDGFIIQPLPFQVRFVPRSEKHVQVIRNDFKSVEGFLKQWE